MTVPLDGLFGVRVLTGYAIVPCYSIEQGKGVWDLWNIVTDEQIGSYDTEEEAMTIYHKLSNVSGSSS